MRSIRQGAPQGSAPHLIRPTTTSTASTRTLPPSRLTAVASLPPSQHLAVATTTITLTILRVTTYRTTQTTSTSTDRTRSSTLTTPPTTSCRAALAGSPRVFQPTQHMLPPAPRLEALWAALTHPTTQPTTKHQQKQTTKEQQQRGLRQGQAPLAECEVTLKTSRTLAIPGGVRLHPGGRHPSTASNSRGPGTECDFLEGKNDDLKEKDEPKPTKEEWSGHRLASRRWLLLDRQPTTSRATTAKRVIRLPQGHAPQRQPAKGL